MNLTVRLRRAWPVGPTMAAGRDFSLRHGLVVFTLCIALTIGALFAADVITARQTAFDVAGRASQNLAQALAQQASDTFEATDGALEGLTERIERDGTAGVAGERLQQSMAAQITAMPRVHGLFVLDDRGELLVSNSSAAPRTDLHLANRPYFRYHRTHPGLEIHISGPAFSATENAWLILVTRRLDRPDGTFAGIAVAEISLDYLEDIYEHVDVGAAGAIGLVADDATIMVRKPRLFIGRSIRQSPIFADPYRYEQAGTYLTHSLVDGGLRLYSFRRLDRYPLVVFVALAESEYLAGWRSTAISNGLRLLLVLAMVGALAVGLDGQIRKRRVAEDLLARQALLDGLTGLANRRQFDAVLEREWRRAGREKTPLALLMIDVDNFKTYNDRCGHQHGDAALIAIAASIAANVRPSDVAARYGGEEFAVILPQTDATSAVAVAERVRQVIAELGLPQADVAAAIASVSIGAAALVPGRASAASTLIKSADTALYDAKRAGRNRTFRMHDAQSVSIVMPASA